MLSFMSSKVRRQFLRTVGPRSLERVSKLGGLEWGRAWLRSFFRAGKRGSVTYSTDRENEVSKEMGKFSIKRNGH